MAEPRLEDVRPILESCRTIAILGATPRVERAGHYVPVYLQSRGYRVVPVSPTRAGTELFGEPVVATLAEIDTPIDMVDVFRRADALPGHVDDILAMDPLPQVVWFQLGIVNDAVAAQLRASGITVVQDRCTLADHRRLFSG